MSFSISYTASSKSEALDKLESAEGVPHGVRAFIAAAIHGFVEVGGNHAESDDKSVSGLAKAPVAMVVSASGHLDAAGGNSSCTISVNKA